jgi:predicted nucleotidyltransferase
MQFAQRYSKLMNPRDLIRELVLKTNPYKPFSSLNKLPYELAIEAFRYLCSQFPAITGVYLRGSLAERKWVPALSDIDLTIVIDESLRLDEEYAFLQSFWKAHKRLKRFFPMLGEIEIFNGSEFRIVRKFGILGYKSETWQKIYGKEVRNLEDVRPDRTTRYVDPINYALQFYLEPFLRGMNEGTAKSYLARVDLARLASKIIRTLNLVDLRSDTEHIRPQILDDGALLEIVLGRLDECVSAFNQQRPQQEAKERILIQDISVPDNENLERLELDSRWLEQMGTWVGGVVVSRRDGFVVLRKEADVVGAGRFLVDSRDLLREKGNFGIVTQRTFEFILRYFNPFLYTDLMENRSVLWGRDVVLDVEPPNQYCFVNFLMKKVKNVIHFPRNRDLIVPERPEVFASTSLAWVMNIAPVIKLYLEKNVFITSYRRAWLEGRRQYPEYENIRRQLWERSSEMSLETLGWEWFRLLKNIGNDIQRYLTDTNVEEHFRQRERQLNSSLLESRRNSHGLEGSLREIS